MPITKFQQTAYGDLSLIRRAVQQIATSTESIAGSLKTIADTSSDQKTETATASSVLSSQLADLVEVVKGISL